MLILQSLQTPLHLACKGGASPKTVKLLLEKDADGYCVNSEDKVSADTGKSLDYSYY